MPEFRMIANCTFEADNLDDAFLKLSRHFAFLEDDEDDDDPQLINKGSIQLEKTDKG